MASDPDTFLYVIGYENGPCKVGYSCSPDARLRAMQRGGHIEAVVLDRSIPVNSRVARASERYAHWLLREFHIDHEWFDVAPPVAIAAIREAVLPEVTRRHDFYDLIPSVVHVRHKIKDGENIMTRFPAGTRARIASLIGGIDRQSAFIREAIEAELSRREAERAERA